LVAVLGRLAPFQRGIYEDYVANFWCATAPAARWKTRFDIPTLARMALGATALAAGTLNPNPNP
jgi:alpha-1,3-glucosyltransferase